MNDLDLVRTLRADVPAPPPARIAAGRNRLLASIASPSPRVRHPWRLALPIGAVTAAAAIAAVAVTVAGLGTHPLARPTARPSAHSAPSLRISLSARVLAVAADKVASEPVTKPHAGQWIYTKFIQKQTGQASQSDENWIRFDGRQSAYFLNGQLLVHNGAVAPAGARGLAAYDDNATPLTAFNALASLPSSPAAILTTVSRIVGTTPRDWENWSSGSVISELAPKNQGEAEFDYLAQLLWNAYAAAPATAEANVYRAMADISGVTVKTDTANAVGRPAIGVSADRGVSWLLLDPQTYQVNGVNEKAISNKSVMVKNAPLTFSGTISMAWAAVALVHAPGVR
ncbi:MAG: CU044_5270 family protein [Streptosporangiaceae bacterium]|jgi:hypothetical protein